MPPRASNLLPSANVGGYRAKRRHRTKLARVLELLQRDCGATLEELIAATDWLPHTTRAALTGLRKRGCAVTFDRHDKGRRETSGSSMTSRYAGREKMEAKAACVRAVKLPK
jgi:hypothetical protein